MAEKQQDLKKHPKIIKNDNYIFAQRAKESLRRFKTTQKYSLLQFLL